MLLNDVRALLCKIRTLGQYLLNGSNCVKLNISKQRAVTDRQTCTFSSFTAKYKGWCENEHKLHLGGQRVNSSNAKRKAITNQYGKSKSSNRKAVKGQEHREEIQVADNQRSATDTFIAIKYVRLTCDYLLSRMPLTECRTKK